MKQTLRKPENWQDFETLCKKLWGEIWSCSEIKKNGRSGQTQHGVDIYGIPNNEKSFFGIQCKGKDDYTGSKLTEKEVDEEIKKARNFEPKLKKLYFATTANKDSSIEEYVRKKHLDNIRLDQFEIHLFSWEDIVDLIEENKLTFDWYVKNINYKSQFSVSVKFMNDLETVIFTPKLYKNYITYKIKKEANIILNNHKSSKEIKNQVDYLAREVQPIRHYLNTSLINKSSSVFSLIITNTGNVPLKNLKVYFEFIGQNYSLDTVDKSSSMFDLTKKKYNTIIHERQTYSEAKGTFEPDRQILVQKDSVVTDKLCIRPNNGDFQKIELKWKLVAEDFDDNGSLFIELKPVVKRKNSTEEYDFANKDIIRFDNYTERE